MQTLITGILILLLSSTVFLSLLSSATHSEQNIFGQNQNFNLSKSSIAPLEKKAVKQFSQYPKILVFSANKSNKGKGKLIAIDTRSASIDGAWNAVSGIGGEEDQPRRGPTPSNTNVNFDHYILTVRPLYLSQKGIEGNFYQYLPFAFRVNGVTRENFGIHADRSVFGTAGCIGIQDGKQWESFKILMSEYQKGGLHKIPLLVANR